MPVNSPDDRHGGERDVTMGDALRLERFQAQTQMGNPSLKLSFPARVAGVEPSEPPENKRSVGSLRSTTATPIGVLKQSLS